MIRIQHIEDIELRRKVTEALAARRGMSATMVPDWYELDDADFVDLLNDIRDAERHWADDQRDSRD